MLPPCEPRYSPAKNKWGISYSDTGKFNGRYFDSEADCRAAIARIGRPPEPLVIPRLQILHQELDKLLAKLADARSPKMARAIRGEVAYFKQLIADETRGG